MVANIDWIILYLFLSCVQTDDLRAVVNHLRADEQVSCIGLWGRSMGAVTWYCIYLTDCLLIYVLRFAVQETILSNNEPLLYFEFL